MGKLSENSDRGGGKWNKSVKVEEEGCNPPPCSQCGGCSDTDFSRKKTCSDMLSSSRPQRRRRVFNGGDDGRNPSRSRVDEGRRFWRGGRSRMDQWFVMMMLLSVFLFVISSIVMGVGGVDAIDLHPHGGFYHREGGNDFYSPQQQSDFGGDDMIMTCSRPSKSSRAAKYLAIKKLDIPCDMQDKKSAWCNLPGDKYPWHAVRRFVFENQGLMRRMYGEVRQLSLLRMEFEDDMDDEFEDERHGPSRSPPLPEDHRRNSILTEVLDESLPRILSETPPEDQILLRDHLVRSTPRTLSTLSSSTPLPPSTSTSASSATPMMASSSEELMFPRGNNDTTEVMITVTGDATSEERNSTGAATTGGVADLTETSVMMGSGDGDVTPSIGNSVRMNGLLEELVTTEEATQATADTTETEANGDEEVTLVTTTEEMLAIGEESGLGLPQEQVAAVAPQEMPSPQQQQQLNDGLDIGATGGVGSDESHDFLNLDKNHILYFDDVGKNRRPAAGNNGNGAADSEGGYVPSQDQQQQQQPGKLKAVNACPVKEEVVAPYWANNTRGEILALLNLYPFEQYIHWERCNHENKQMFCRQGCRCEQQYRLHRLLAFDPTNECRGIFSDWFRFPSCCVCRCYLNEYELMMLNAAGQEPSASSAQSKSRTSDRIRSPRKLLLDQLVDGPDVQGVDDMHFFYKQGVYTEHNHGAQPRRKR